MTAPVYDKTGTYEIETPRSVAETMKLLEPERNEAGEIAISPDTWRAIRQYAKYWYGLDGNGRDPQELADMVLEFWRSEETDR